MLLPTLVLTAGAGHNGLSLVVVAEEILLARALECKKRAASDSEP